MKKKIRKKKKRIATKSLISLLLPCFDQRKISSRKIKYIMNIAKNVQSWIRAKMLVNKKKMNNVMKNEKLKTKKMMSMMYLLIFLK